MMIYNHPDKYLGPASTLKALEHDCINYLYEEPIEYKKLSKQVKERIALTQYMFEQEQQNRTLFHMSITYKPYKDRIYTEKDINVFFKTFYLQKFLPYLLNTKNYCTVTMKLIQPITFAFVDEHEQTSVVVKKFNPLTKSYVDNVEFPIKLHHHVIIAVHNDHLERMNNLVGSNTLANSYFTSKIMTSDIKQCEPLRLMYASKKFKRYPDFMSFPDKFYRGRNKYNHTKYENEKT